MEPAREWQSQAGEDLVAEAHDAARRGAVDELHLALARLRVVAPQRSEALSEKLHMIADCVRAHPSYGPDEASPPLPGEGRATG